MKRVILEAKPMNTACLNEVNKDKVYILAIEGTHYKACQIDSKYSFLYLNDSRSFWSGYYSSLEKLIEYSLDCYEKVFEFNTFKEVAKAIIEGKI